MQSVIRCTHYVAGASEQHYINKTDDPTVEIHGAHRNSDSGKLNGRMNGTAPQNWDCMFSVCRRSEFWRPPSVRIGSARS